MNEPQQARVRSEEEVLAQTLNNAVHALIEANQRVVDVYTVLLMRAETRVFKSQDEAARLGKALSESERSAGIIRRDLQGAELRANTLLKMLEEVQEEVKSLKKTL